MGDYLQVIQYITSLADPDNTENVPPATARLISVSQTESIQFPIDDPLGILHTFTMYPMRERYDTIRNRRDT